MNAKPILAIDSRFVNPSVGIPDTAYNAILIELTYNVICVPRSPKSFEPIIACLRPNAGSIEDCKDVNTLPTLANDSRFVRLSVEIPDTADIAVFMLSTKAEI